MSNFENKHPMFIQLVTGDYTYVKKETGQVGTSHCIYALDEDGDTWKFVPNKQDWYMFKDLQISYDDDHGLNF